MTPVPYPLLGIIDSAKSGHLTNFYAISTATVDSSGASSITFSSIPQGYTHLQIRGFAIASSGTPGLGLQFNGDTTTHYPWHLLQGDGSSASASSGLTGANVYIADISTNGGAFVVDVLDYTNTNKNKTVRSLAGYDANGSGIVALKSGFWPVTYAISSLTIFGATFSQYTTFSLYGVK